MQNKHTHTILLALVACFFLVSPESAWAISDIDSGIDKFKNWVIEDVAQNIAILALVLWALNAQFGWLKGATHWGFAAGLVITNLIIFGADAVVSFFA